MKAGGWTRFFTRANPQAIAVSAIALAIGAIVSSSLVGPLRGLSIDTLTALDRHLFARPVAAASSPTAVIVFDEDTYQSPPFNRSPTVLWTREIGQVLGAVFDANPRVVGFDVVFPTSIEESEIPFEGDTIGARLRGFDRDFLKALSGAAKSGQLVLGEIQHGDEYIMPAAGQRVAVGQQRNIRSLNVVGDSDGVVRRVPLLLSAGDRMAPSMSLELASRAVGAAPQIDGDRLSLAGKTIPLDGSNAMTLNFAGASREIPTFSFADLRACLQKGDRDFFRRNFEGKVVLLGSRLDSGDLKATSMRFIDAPISREPERCVARDGRPAPPSAGALDGVYIHAMAVNNILLQDAIAELSSTARLAIVTGAALAAAIIASVSRPQWGALSMLALGAAWTFVAAAIFHSNLSAPLIETLLAGFLAYVATIGHRLVVTDKDKRLIRKNFEFYLSPSVIERMMSSGVPPALGGELRNVTIFFSDLVGYSSLSEKLSPTDLVALMNDYLSAMTETIEEHGGFVDKYVGDAIVAVFGAPMEMADHAAAATNAAIECCRKLDDLNAKGAARNAALAHRIGLNSGAAIVGNIGSRRRFNYTAIGDAVNLASRLESANRYFATSVLASESTVSLAKATFIWREVDTIRVKGRAQPVRVYEPIAPAEKGFAEKAALFESYADGLAHWRGRDFSGAAQAFGRYAGLDPPSARFLERARNLDRNPPSEDWEPIRNLE